MMPNHRQEDLTMEDFQDNVLDAGLSDTPTDTADLGQDDGIDFEDFSLDEGDDTDSYQEEPSEPQFNQQGIRIKYNHEERDLSYDEAVELAQKGMNYEKAMERASQEAEQRALDNFIAQQGYEWNDQPITTYAEYQQALAEQELMEKYGNVPEEVVQELLENRRFREQYMAQQEEAKQQQYQNQQFQELVESFPDVDPESIPSDVWQKFESGIPLKYAYMEYEMTKLKTANTIQQQNLQNKTKAPIQGVTSFGNGEPQQSRDLFLEGFDS
jgi:hypothetical protein